MTFARESDYKMIIWRLICYTYHMNIKKLFDYSQPLVAASTLLALAMIIVVIYGSQVVYSIKLAGDTIEVTGSAKTSVVADTGRLTINIETKTGLDDKQAGTARVQRGVDSVVAYLKTQGFTEMETPVGFTNTDYYYPQNAPAVQTGYTISRSVVVRGTDLEKMKVMANDTSKLAGSGYTVTTGSFELTYSKLDEVRVSLLTQAIKVATYRAGAIAQNSGRSVGKLRNAVGGVVQVLPQGGVDISDYGTYDTASMNKDIMVTTRATFGLK